MKNVIEPPLQMLCPWGIAGDEPLFMGDFETLGIRQLVARGHMTKAEGMERYPTGDWSVVPD